jgi:hypothetical protein
MNQITRERSSLGSTASEIYITPSVGGWKGTQANIAVSPAGIVSTSGGYSITTQQQPQTISGFSLTAGAGNYGYYIIDLGSQQKDATLLADMYLLVSANGLGFWNIVASPNLLNNNQFTTSATQVWNSYQNLSWGQIYSVSTNGNWLVRTQLQIPFSGQYLYLGAVDQGQGQLGISLTNVSVV